MVFANRPCRARTCPETSDDVAGTPNVRSISRYGFAAVGPLSFRLGAVNDAPHILHPASLIPEYSRRVEAVCQSAGRVTTYQVGVGNGGGKTFFSGVRSSRQLGRCTEGSALKSLPWFLTFRCN